MIRFIDLGQQIGVTSNHPRQFAFFTVGIDVFVEMNGNQVWDSWKSFEKDYSEENMHEQDVRYMQRFKSLCPTWVHR